MPYKIRAFDCEDCGRWTLRRRASNGIHVCVECGRKRMAEAARAARLESSARKRDTDTLE